MTPAEVTFVVGWRQCWCQCSCTRWLFSHPSLDFKQYLAVKIHSENWKHWQVLLLLVAEGSVKIYITIGLNLSWQIHSLHANVLIKIRLCAGWWAFLVIQHITVGGHSCLKLIVHDGDLPTEKQQYSIYSFCRIVVVHDSRVIWKTFKTLQIWKIRISISDLFLWFIMICSFCFLP